VGDSEGYKEGFGSLKPAVRLLTLQNSGEPGAGGEPGMERLPSAYQKHGGGGCLAQRENFVGAGIFQGYWEGKKFLFRGEQIQPGKCKGKRGEEGKSKYHRRDGGTDGQ